MLVLTAALFSGVHTPSVAQESPNGQTKSLAHQPWPKGDPRTWVSNSDFPASAKGDKGATTFRLDVDATGQVTACEIVKSSGSVTLDRATCSLMTTRGRFVPAQDDAGKPIAGTHVQTMRWGE